MPTQLRLLYVQLQSGVNLAQWLVNSPDAVKKELEAYSQGFMDFWKEQRTDYWQQVAKAKAAFAEEQKGSNGVRQHSRSSQLLHVTSCAAEARLRCVC